MYFYIFFHPRIFLQKFLNNNFQFLNKYNIRTQSNDTNPHYSANILQITKVTLVTQPISFLLDIDNPIIINASFLFIYLLI